MAGGIVQTGAYKKGEGREEVQQELREGLEVLIDNDVDLIIVEYFHCVEEIEWALELALSYNKPVAATMCIGPTGDGKVLLMMSMMLMMLMMLLIMTMLMMLTCRACPPGSAR